MVRIPTKDNFMADFISRNHDHGSIMAKFAVHGIKKMASVTIPDNFFYFTAEW